jgi:hypothetical protein
MISGKRLDIEDIDTGAGNAFGPQRRDQIRFEHDRPARSID